MSVPYVCVCAKPFKTAIAYAIHIGGCDAMRKERTMSLSDLMKLDKEQIARHAQEGWDLANRRTVELARYKAALEHVVKAERVAEHRTGAVVGCPFCEAAQMVGSSIC